MQPHNNSFNGTRIVTALLMAVACCGMLPHSADAVQWQALTSTNRYRIAFDAESVRLTPLGRLGVWLRFIPLNETQRKAAAAEYEEKQYRSHLEQYEIDCSEQNAVLLTVDIFGVSQNRLRRRQGNGRPEVIIPGSVLERVADQICPALQEEPITEEAAAESGPAAEPKDAADSQLQLKLKELAATAAQKPQDSQAWRALGNGYFDADLPAEAIAAYAHALKLLPDDTDMLNDQGAMYRQIRDFPRALANFEKAFRIDPRNLESLYNSAYVYAFDLNNIKKALELWQQYLQRDTESESARQVQTFVERFQKARD